LTGFTNLNNPSRRNTTKILTIGNYSVMIIDIIQGLVFIPLYLNYIGERLYGLWLGTGGILAVLAFMDVGMASLTIQRISREYGLKNYEGISKYFSGGILINSGFMAILLITGFILSFFLGNIFRDISANENEILTLSFQIALFGLIFSLLNNTIEGTLNALQKPLMSKIFQLTGAITGIIFVYFMLMGEKPLLAIATGTLIRGSISLFPNLLYTGILFKKNNIALYKWDKTTFKDYLKLTPNLMLSKFGTSLVGNIEPTLINIFLSPEVAVFFSVTKKGGGLVKMFLDRIGGVLFPSMAHLYSEKNNLQYKTFCLKLLSFILPLSLLLFILYILLNKSFVALWVGPDNFLGYTMTILIGASLILSFFSNLLSYLLATTGDIKFSSNSVFFESVLNVALLLILLIYLGVYGLPIALIISGLIFIVVYLKRWNKHLNLNITQIKKIIKEQGLNFIVLLVCGFIIHNILKYSETKTWFDFITKSIVSFFFLSFFLIITNPVYNNFFKHNILKKT